MSTAPEAPAAPPIDALVAELIATLAFAAEAYLEPKAGQPDIDAAVLACDVAGVAFERISPRLGADERRTFAALLTNLRLAIVKKRG
jgi:hypothetical protein